MSNPLSLAYHVGDYLLRHKMKHMILHVTGHCNFRCEHCFVEFDDPSKRDMKLSQYQELAAETPELFWLDIGGGEPFLRKDLAEIISGFKAKVVHIPTNGSLIPQMLKQVTRIRELTQAEVIIGLSLDGLEETHDKIRKEPGSFQQVWEAHRALKDIPGVSVKVCTVINSKNFHEIIPLMEQVYDQGVDFHSVILLRGQTLDPDMKLPSLIELRELGKKMFPILARYDYGRMPLSSHILRNFHRHLWNTSLATLERRTQVIPCLAGKTQVTVWGDGGVAACEMLPTVGNIKEGGLGSVIASDAYQEQLKFIADKRCHCTHNCAMLDSIFFNPANYPKLLATDVV